MVKDYLVCGKCETRVQAHHAESAVVFDDDKGVYAPDSAAARMAAAWNFHSTPVKAHTVRVGHLDATRSRPSGTYLCGPLREPTAADEYLAALETAFGPLVS